MTLNYLGICFMLLTFERAGRFSASVYHFVFIYIAVGFFYFRFSGITKKAHKLQAKADELRAAKKPVVATTDAKQTKQE